MPQIPLVKVQMYAYLSRILYPYSSARYAQLLRADGNRALGTRISSLSFNVRHVSLYDMQDIQHAVFSFSLFSTSKNVLPIHLLHLFQTHLNHLAW